MKVVNKNKRDINDDVERFVTMYYSKLIGKQIVSIAKGGDYFAQLISNKLYGNANQIIYVKCQRPTSKNKKANKSIFKLINNFPYFILNILRNIEHHLLSMSNNLNREIIINKPANIPLVSNEYLIIDDAVDSGVTLHEIINYFKLLNPSSQIITYAYVVTKKNPIVMPDIYSYRNVLIRFPWSIDWKNDND